MDCDSCRAMWLTGFAEEDRRKASEAIVSLFKVGQIRMLNELDTVVSDPRSGQYTWMPMPTEMICC